VRLRLRKLTVYRVGDFYSVNKISSKVKIIYACQEGVFSANLLHL